METKIAVFRAKEIRKTIHNNEWWFSVADVVEALTETANSADYIKKMRKRDAELAKGWGQIVTPLWLETSGGKQKASVLLTRVERLPGRREKTWNERPARRLSPQRTIWTFPRRDGNS